MNLATFLDDGPSVPTGVEAGWEAYLRATRANLEAAFDRMVVSYHTLKNVQDALGKPLIKSGEAGGALTIDENLGYVEAAALVERSAAFIDDALAGRRKLGYDASGNLVIEGSATEDMRIEMVGGRPKLLDPQGNPVQIEGQLSAIAFGAVIVVAVIAVAVVFAVEKICDTLAVQAEQKTTQSIAQASEEVVKKGGTPEQAKALSNALMDGARGLEEARAKKKEAEKDTGFGGSVKALATAGIVIASIYLLAQVIPMFARRPAAQAAA